VVQGTRIGQGRLHAIVDLGFIETVDQAHVLPATSLARRLVDGLGPGSTTLLAGSVPSTRNGFVTTARDRPEVALWLAVAGEVDGIRYGDYGVVHPTVAAAKASAMRPPHPYLYYTVSGAMISLRKQPATVDGRQPSGAAAEAFAELATELVNRPEFAGRDYSWGDRELARCRSGGRQSAGSVSKWLAMATSHHLQHLARHTPDNL
jgi:hypothetical protein